MWYWITEYGKVFLGYLSLMFLWPSVVFHGYLRGKSKTYRFSFCVIVPIVIINTVVLCLGLFHWLSQWMIRLIFYGVFALAILINIVSHFDREYKRMGKTKFPDVRSLNGKYRFRVLIALFFVACYRYVKRAVGFLGFDYFKRIKTYNWQGIRLRVKEAGRDLRRKISCFFWEYGILALVLVFGMIYLSYGAFQVRSYGAGDLYVHHQWIYGLIGGNIFTGKVYPEAMHCFIYCMHSLFGIKVDSILLFLQGIHVAVFFLAAYLLLRKVFRWKYTPIFVLMLFLSLDLSNADLINSMYRLQMTLPMEFCLHTVFLSALYLENYLHSDNTDVAGGREEKVRKFCWDENLLLFMMSLAAVIMTHFHVVIMALIVCAAFALFLLKRIFSRKHLLPLMAAVLCGCLLGIIPMIGALAQGMQFNASINWAVNSMSGEESRDLRNLEDNEEDVDDVGRQTDNSKEFQDMKRNGFSITRTIIDGMTEIYENGYAALYGSGRGAFILALTIAVIAFCWLTRANALKSFRGTCVGYRPVILASILYVIVYAAPMIGLPDIIPEGRFFAPGHMLLLAVMVIPVDVLFSGLMNVCNGLIMRMLSLLVVMGIYGVTYATGNFRGFLFYQITRYDAAAMVTESIIDTFPKNSYTIVSPTDETYPVIQYGWHEELFNFVTNCSNTEYSIPSEYVFIYVEKEPLLYAQCHFLTGPSWMGEEKYLAPFWKMYSAKYPDSEASQSPEIIAAKVSKEAAEKDIPEDENAWTMYIKLETRSLLESKAYEWCQQFEQKHPSTLNVYYEDDSFVCYYFRQDLGSPPYELGVE